MTPEQKAKVTEFFKNRCSQYLGERGTHYTIDNITYSFIYHGVGFVIIKLAGKGQKNEITISY